MGDDGSSITLGEVGRNVERLTTEVSHLAEKFGTLAVEDAKQGEKIARLEKIIYGAVGVAGAALITAMVSALITLANGQ